MRTHARAWIGLAIGLGLAAGCRSEHQVTLELTGDIPRIRAAIALPNSTQNSTVKLPWSQSFRSADGPQVGVQAADYQSGGTLHCAIIVDGVVWKQATTELPGRIDCVGILGGI